MVSRDEKKLNAQSAFPEVRNKSDPRIKEDSTDAIRVGLCDLNWNKLEFCFTIRGGNKHQQGEFKTSGRDPFRLSANSCSYISIFS